MARNSRSRAMPFVTIDAETDPFDGTTIPEPFIWGYYDGQTGEYCEFEDAAALARRLRDFRGLVYAHNGGRFDYHYLRGFINSDDAVMVISGRLAKFKIGTAQCRDSFNILVNPLAAFQKSEIDYAKLKRDVRAQHMPEIRAYLRSDCVNLWDTIKRYFDEYGRSLTQAGASMRYWKEKYKFPFEPQNAIQSEQCRPFYYGGRVECFQTGHALQDFRIVDRNSAYPDAMRSRHPISPHSAPLNHLPDSDLSQCFMRIEARARGCFPWRDPEGSDNRLEFPNDDRIREYSITGWELQAAFECNAVDVVRVVECRRFMQTVDFGDYVAEFYGKRLAAKAAGDKVGDVFAKLFMNSLYGKFAADPEKYHEYVIATDDSFAFHAARGYLELGPWGDGRILMERPLPESRHRYYNVATAASITGKVRADLFKSINACDGVLYCDTDSIFARDVSRLDIGDKLGQWKVEAHCSEWAIAGKKTYAVKLADGSWKVRSKGAKLTHEEMIRVAHGEAVTYRPQVPTYSVHKPLPAFVPRIITRTGKTLHNLN